MSLRTRDKPLNGTIKNVCEVHCAGCEEAALGLMHPQLAAERELREQWGWAKRRGLWHCARCKDAPAQICRAARR